MVGGGAGERERERASHFPEQLQQLYVQYYVEQQLEFLSWLRADATQQNAEEAN